MGECPRVGGAWQGPELKGLMDFPLSEVEPQSLEPRLGWAVRELGTTG